MSALHKFLFEGMPVRGMLVRLEGDWQELLARRGGATAPAGEAGAAEGAALTALLGEMSAAAVLLQASITFDGALILQIQGDGPVRLAVAEARSDLRFRATANLAPGVRALPDDARFAQLLNAHGKGRCAITLDAREREPSSQPYQGIVPLSDERGRPLPDLASAVAHYMKQSEQLDTRLVLAASGKVAAGLLVQRLPKAGSINLGGSHARDASAGEAADDDFERIAHKATTLTREELLGLDADAILRRLFWEEPLARYAPLQPRFACTCSRERVARMIEGLGQTEANDIVSEQGSIGVTCEFCGTRYAFDAVDVGAMFTPGVDRAVDSDRMH